jgi:hypothetical protein
MLIFNKTRPNLDPVEGAYTLTRNNLEFAGIVVYFFSLLMVFSMTLVLMLFQPGDGMFAKAANDHQPPKLASFGDSR